MDLKRIRIKPVINKSNGQINFSLPKKKLSKEFIEKCLDVKNKGLNITFEDFE